MVHHHQHERAGSAPATRGHVLHWGRFYDTSTNVLLLGGRKRLRRETIALAQLRPGESVLEVGCGTGDLALLSRQEVGMNSLVCGVDPAADMLETARGKAARQGVQVDFQLGVIEALAFPDQSFDVVLSSMMMHHLPDDLKVEGLAEIKRVLKPGGRLLIVDAKRPDSTFTRALSHLAMHGHLQTGVQDLVSLLEQAGFANVETGSLSFRVLGYTRGVA